jgi:hypothetical protein
MSEASSDLPHPESLEPSPLVERLTRAGAEPGGQVTIVGYIGPSPSDGRTRVYLDLTLSSYCDIAASDIVGTAPIDSTSEISPSIVWVKLGAKIDRVDTNRSTTVLQGQIQQTYLSQALRNFTARMRNRALLWPAGGGRSDENSCFVCASDLCPKPSEGCPSTGWACAPSHGCPPPPKSMGCPV